MIARIPCSSLYLTHVQSIRLDKPWPFSACHFASSWFQRVQEFSWALLFIRGLFNGGWKICLFIQIVCLSSSLSPGWFYCPQLFPFIYPNRAFHHSVNSEAAQESVRKWADVQWRCFISDLYHGCEWACLRASHRSDPNTTDILLQVELRKMVFPVDISNLPTCLLLCHLGALQHSISDITTSKHKKTHLSGT